MRPGSVEGAFGEPKADRVGVVPDLGGTELRADLLDNAKRLLRVLVAQAEGIGKGGLDWVDGWVSPGAVMAQGAYLSIGPILSDLTPTEPGCNRPRH